ncbi:hypothetical protein [Achromobacter anxifer]|jgi:hypothetical protein|uniref:Uncharacterized protein n=1 Tax=Achromobacter anxifer TaxID=1287737 RepID=A0A6S7EJP1_9BURK|nr:hypothetical protein [Achromobacter anxifer]MDF8363200.1 hypothetical protein [Achromobacter anxifer]CAB3915431.1 hypothetical protein LMG26858_04982 [Achromobacter anxifer]
MAFYLFAALFAVSLTAVLAASAVYWLRSGLAARETRRWLYATACVLLSYLIGLGLICHDPYFDDNGLPEFIPWRFRWAWAWIYAGLLQFAVVPCGFALRAALRFLAARKAASAAQ